MSEAFLSVSFILIAALQLQDSSCQHNSNHNNSLLPLAEGNEWIYVDSIFEDGKLISAKNDTNKILSTSTFEGRTTYIFSDGRELLLKNDSLFQLVKQRTGVKFPTTVFLPTESETTFNYLFGGDVVIHQNVTLMKNCPVNSWSISKCFQVTDDCGSETIFGYGIGILREKKVECGSSGKNYSVRKLIGVKFN